MPRRSEFVRDLGNKARRHLRRRRRCGARIVCRAAAAHGCIGRFGRRLHPQPVSLFEAIAEVDQPGPQGQCSPPQPSHRPDQKHHQTGDAKRNVLRGKAFRKGGKQSRDQRQHACQHRGAKQGEAQRKQQRAALAVRTRGIELRCGFNAHFDARPWQRIAAPAFSTRNIGWENCHSLGGAVSACRRIALRLTM
jgi:hypothetical protein